MLTGLIKFVVVDGSMCINCSGMNRYRLTLAGTKFQPAGKRSQGRTLERFLRYIEIEREHRS